MSKNISLEDFRFFQSLYRGCIAIFENKSKNGIVNPAHCKKYQSKNDC